MSSNGFIPELLVPGALTIIGAFVIAAGIFQFQPDDLEGLETAVVVPILLAVAYLLGLSLRHSSFDRFGMDRLTVNHRSVFRNRLVLRWPTFTKQLIAQWSEPDDGFEVDLELDELTPDQAAALVNRLRIYQLSVYEAGFTEHLNYQWNLARMAKNSTVPLCLISGSSITAAISTASRSSGGLAVGYFGLTIFCVLMVLGLRRVNVDRLEYHLDTLVLAHQAHNRHS